MQIYFQQFITACISPRTSAMCHSVAFHYVPLLSSLVSTVKAISERIKTNSESPPPSFMPLRDAGSVLKLQNHCGYHDGGPSDKRASAVTKEKNNAINKLRTGTTKHTHAPSHPPAPPPLSPPPHPTQKPIQTQPQTDASKDTLGVTKTNRIRGYQSH